MLGIFLDFDKIVDGIDKIIFLEKYKFWGKEIDNKYIK